MNDSMSSLLLWDLFFYLFFDFLTCLGQLFSLGGSLSLRFPFFLLLLHLLGHHGQSFKFLKTNRGLVFFNEDGFLLGFEYVHEFFDLADGTFFRLVFVGI